MVTPAARREAVAHLRVAFEVSERRACSTLCTDRTSVRYRSRRPSDAAARGRLRELALVRRRVRFSGPATPPPRAGNRHEHKKTRPPLPQGPPGRRPPGGREKPP